ncbi:MAG: MFS transporter [Hyphomicrobiales bacterium]|nr:MFS transporter [Hyphomicrobiales bacterium]MBV9907779.1 MFS transporter [Hyphomicrobiales bacterium]
MSAEHLGPAPAFRVSDLILHGAEPPPVALLTRLGSYPWLVVGACCIAGLMGQIDASIVQLALPTLGRVFDTTLESVSWVALSYLLGVAAFMPIFGQLCRIFGRKLFYIVGFVVFTSASALCGYAPDLLTLVGLRFLQGVGGAMIGANSMALVVEATDKSRRGRALGLYAAAQAIGISAGPVAGGLLIGTLGWPWVFWVNVPVGVISIIAAWLVLPVSSQQGPSQTFDWRGALLLAPALTLAVLALNQASALGLISPVLLGSVGAAAVLIFLFVRQEGKTPSPLVDLALLKGPAFLGGALACALSYAMLYGMFFLASFALVRGYEDSPVVAGLKLAIVPISIGVSAPIAGGLADWMGARLLSVAGMALCFIALVALTAVVMEPAPNLWAGFVALVAFGAGLGAFIAPNNHATINTVPANLAGVAGATLNLTRILGTVAGVASASAVLSWRLQAARGSPERKLTVFSPHHFIEAVAGGLVMLAVFALIAGAVSLIRKPAA